MKAIFLDVDGVLNNMQHCAMLHRLLGDEQYCQIHRELGEMPFDYISCSLLQKLILITGAEIVLSSTWRVSDEHIKTLEKYSGIKVKDKTPRLDGIRGEEIKQYLEQHPEITNYVIIDDDSDMLENQISHFVKCNAQFGFTDKKFEQALKILESEE